jgi:hypothetical protein
MKGGTYTNKSGPGLENIVDQRVYEVEVRHKSHLTVYFCRDIQADKVDDDVQEGGHARNGVNLCRSSVV